VLIEPIQGEGGFVVPPDGFLAGLAEWCAQHGIVFIADEIQTGFCRTGEWFASTHDGVVPDLITTAKVSRRPAPGRCHRSGGTSWTPSTRAASAGPTAAIR
jgi:4-aminobutyrate aminotransferase-like enzyme